MSCIEVVKNSNSVSLLEKVHLSALKHKIRRQRIIRSLYEVM